MKKTFGVSAFATGLFLVLLTLTSCQDNKKEARSKSSFNENWKFHLGSIDNGSDTALEDSGWRTLNLPHDWSIEGEFSADNPATPGGGALPGGVGWYRKTFSVPEIQKDEKVFIDFDGVYCNSEVWINGHSLGIRPSGYISFRYDLTPYLKYGSDKNIIAVKVDNSQQPNSRWYSGSGIYRNVWLTVTDPVHVDHWGTFITTPKVSDQQASVELKATIRNDSEKEEEVQVISEIVDPSGKTIGSKTIDFALSPGNPSDINQQFTIDNPSLWSLEKPALYKAVVIIKSNGGVKDRYETTFGIRNFEFDSEKGFSLNGKHVKILGVCDHHDLGCLGSAINTRALERQLEILRGMGVNAIRTSHNPPAPELLDLCDKMGFIVMDEMFDMWKKKKTEYDYSQYWDEWHARDLRDFIRRDRNHPSVFIWSIGNEILEQWDSTGTPIAKELAGIVHELDTTRPITSACNDPRPWNNIIKSGVLDLIGYNYHHQDFENFPKDFPGQKFIATETTSALATRGHYDMPSDSIRRWPIRWDKPFTQGNPDNTVSAYDNVSAPWGSTHEETWKAMKKHDYLSGMFIWTGFDYLGEPTPYSWPSRSSYFGVIDLAGFPKDSYYMYQSEWTDTPVLHIFPHWNWHKGDSIDVWAYTNADEVELFLNGNSLGTKKKGPDDLHLQWSVAFTPGVIKGVARKDGKEFLTKEVKTAGAPAKIILEPDRTSIDADGKDLSFVTVKVEDKDGTIVPDADNRINFKVSGSGFIAGVDNGDPVSHDPFKADYRKAFHGLCLAVIQSDGEKGEITLTATADGLEGASSVIECK